MNDFSPLVAIGVALLIFFVLFVAGISHAARQRQLQNFASQWNGRIDTSGFFGYPEVIFQLGEARATLSYSAHGDDDTQTHLTIPLGESRLRLELRPQGLAHRIIKFLGMEDIEIGDRDFDDAFVIQGSDRLRIRDFLTPPIRAAIMQLARCRPPHRFDLHLAIGGGMLRVTKHVRITESEDLSRFVRCCQDLLNHIQMPLSAGIEFVDKQSPVAAHKTECQVCGDPLVNQIVYCMKCKTPHHVDCWKYFGSCAVYGCGQKRYIVFQP